jgi:hypothetical protein
MGLALVLTLVAIFLLWDYGVRSAGRALSHLGSSAKRVAPPQQLSSDGQASSCGIIHAGNLSELRWPDFSDYAPQLMMACGCVAVS